MLDAVTGAVLAGPDVDAVGAAELDRREQVEGQKAADHADRAEEAVGIAALVAIGLDQQREIHGVAEHARPHADAALAVGDDV